MQMACPQTSVPFGKCVRRARAKNTLQLTCSTVCIGQKTTRGHYTSAKISDVRTISGCKNGVEESVTSANCAVGMCEAKCNPKQENATPNKSALFRTSKVSNNKNWDMAAQKINLKAIVMRAPEKCCAVFEDAGCECGVLHPRSERKILDRVLKNMFEHSCNRVCCVSEEELPACLAVTRCVREIPCERSEHTQVQDVDEWESCWNLWLWFEQSTTDFRVAPAFATPSFCGISAVRLQFDPNSSFLRTCGCCLACTYCNRNRFQSICTTSELPFFCAFRKWCLAVSSSWLSGLRDPAWPWPLVLPTRHCKLLERIITCFVISFNLSFFPASSSGRIAPHLRKKLSCCIVIRTVSCCRWLRARWCQYQALSVWGAGEVESTQFVMRSWICCCWSGSINRSNEAWKSSWTAGACNATSHGLSCNIVWSCPTALARHSAGASPKWVCHFSCASTEPVSHNVSVCHLLWSWRAVTPNFSDRAPLCFLAEARLRSNMTVCLIFCLFLLKSDHPTGLCRGAAGNLNVWRSLSIRAAFRPRVWRTQDSLWSRAMTLIARLKAGVSSQCLCQHISKRTLFEPIWNFTNHASAVDLGSMFGNFVMTFSTTAFQGQAPSRSWKFGSDLRILVNSLEIMSCSCEFLPLYPTAYHRVVPNCLFFLWWLESNRSPDARPGGFQLAWVQPVGWWWRCDLCEAAIGRRCPA